MVIGLGGSGTNDAGAGLLLALAEAAGLAGSGWSERLGGGGAALRGIGPAELAPLARLRQVWGDLDLVLASDVDIPLLGFHGASAAFSPQKGADPGQAQALERCLGDFAAAAVPAAGAAARLASEPGAGAAGGLGFVLLLLGDTDLVVTGEGRFDWQSLRGKVVAGVARAAQDVGAAVVVIAGQVEVGRREAQAIGIDAAYPVATGAAQIADSLADPWEALARRAQQVARTWSH